MVAPDKIELASYVSWPAFEQADYRGLILRFAEGCTKRSNSANSDRPPKSGTTWRKWSRIVSHFTGAKNLPTIFRMFSFIDNAQLDSYLVDQGYVFTEPSLSFWRNHWMARPIPRLRSAAGPGRVAQNFRGGYRNRSPTRGRPRHEINRSSAVDFPVHDFRTRRKAGGMWLWCCSRRLFWNLAHHQQSAGSSSVVTGRSW